MSTTNPLFAWQDTKTGLVIIVIIDLFLTYLFALMAIDSGSLLNYLAAFVFLSLTITQAVRLARKVMHRG